MANDSKTSNATFAAEDRMFRQCCAEAGIEPTRRQAAKWRQKRGRALSAKRIVDAKAERDDIVSACARGRESYCVEFRASRSPGDNEGCRFIIGQIRKHDDRTKLAVDAAEREVEHAKLRHAVAMVKTGKLGCRP